MSTPRLRFDRLPTGQVQITPDAPITDRERDLISSAFQLGWFIADDDAKVAAKTPPPRQPKGPTR